MLSNGCEDIFGGIGRVEENYMGDKGRGVLAGGGEGSETGPMTEGEGQQTEDQHRCQPHPYFREK